MFLNVPRTELLALRDGNIIFAYADNILIIGKTQEKVKKGIIEMMKAGKSIELRVNMEKMKYIIMTRKIKALRDITIGNNRIEQIRYFKCLGVTLDKQNNMYGEINIRLATANRCYFAPTNLFRSKLI